MSQIGRTTSVQEQIIQKKHILMTFSFRNMYYMYM